MAYPAEAELRRPDAARPSGGLSGTQPELGRCLQQTAKLWSGAVKIPPASGLSVASILASIAPAAAAECMVALLAAHCGNDMEARNRLALGDNSAC